MPVILIVEDDAAIVHALTEYLASEGLGAQAAAGEREALQIIKSDLPDLVLIDIALSDGDGFAVCVAAKELGVPVIFLTASGDEDSVVRGLDLGAEDYVSKPFRPRELVSRIRNALRRGGREQANVRLGQVLVDTAGGIVMKNGAEIALSALEYRLLLAFVNNRGRLMTRNMLLEEIWDAAGNFVNDNTLTVYIKRLREKIEDDPQKPEHIKTVRGLGYRLE